MRFEWDEAKDLSNRRKHGIPFAEARELFTSGSDYLEIYDATHSQEEERFIAIGTIPRGTVVVVWTSRREDTIRIVSARRATAGEQTRYHRYMDEGR